LKHISDCVVLVPELAMVDIKAESTSCSTFNFFCAAATLSRFTSCWASLPKVYQKMIFRMLVSFLTFFQQLQVPMDIVMSVGQFI